jgi:hypothetical protein
MWKPAEAFYRKRITQPSDLGIWHFIVPRAWKTSLIKECRRPIIHSFHQMHTSKKEERVKK